MTQEEKDILIADLCGRQPYGLIIKCNDGFRQSKEKLVSIDFGNELINYDWRLTDIKPFLRPMGTMTEEEYNEMFNEFYLAQEEFSRDYSNTCFVGKIIGNDMVRLDWLNKNMFDFRWLIRKGLALEAPEGMYNEK